MDAKRRILERDDYECQLCGKLVEMDNSNLDHIIELEHGGTHDDDNLRTLCTDCHTKRHGGTPKRTYDAMGNPIGDPDW